MMVSSEAAIWGTEHLTAADFYREAHAQIFEAVRHLVAHKVEVDFLTLFDYFRVRGLAEDIGGASFVAGLADGVPKNTNIAYYAGILQNDRIRRDLLNISDQIVAEVVDGELRGPALIDKADEWLLALPRPDREDDLTLMSARTTGLYADFEARLARKGMLAGLDTGLDAINDMTSGLQAGDLTIIAARPSVGKTALASFFCLAAARRWKAENTKKVAGFFSLEMSREQVEYRFVSALSNVMLFRILAARGLADWEQQRIGAAIFELGDLPIAIDSTGRITVEVIRSKARRLQAMHGLGLLVVDYIQLITGSGVGKADRGNRNAELTHASRSLKLLGKELGVPVVMLSQLSRAPEGREDKRPKMSDLRESGALEQDADNIMMLHRPPSEDGPGCITEVIIEKQRNGPTGIVSVYFEKEVMRFREVRDEDRPHVEAVVEEDRRQGDRRSPRRSPAPRPAAFQSPSFLDE
jgi:replicative DNA helicase